MSPPCPSPRRKREDIEGDEVELGHETGERHHRHEDEEGGEDGEDDDEEEDHEEEQEEDTVVQDERLKSGDDEDAEPADPHSRADWNDFFEGEDDFMGDDYGEDEFESSVSSSEADMDDLPERMWPDPFDEGTEDSSAPRSLLGSPCISAAPTPSRLARDEEALGTHQLLQQAVVRMAGLARQGLQFWTAGAEEAVQKADRPALAWDAVSMDLKVICLARRPCVDIAAEVPCASPREGSEQLSHALGDFRICPASYWASFHGRAAWPSPTSGSSQETRPAPDASKAVKFPAAPPECLMPPVPAKPASVLLTQPEVGGSSSSSSSCALPPCSPCSSGSSSSFPRTAQPPTAPAPTLMANNSTSKGGRRLVCARQKSGHSSMRPRPPASRPERRAVGPRSAKLQASRPTSVSSMAPANTGGQGPSGRSAKDELPVAPAGAVGSSSTADENRAKTPCYEVSEEEFERLVMAGALAGGHNEVEDEESAQIYEISEDEFERLLKAGLLHPAPQEATENDLAAEAGARRMHSSRRLRPRGGASSPTVAEACLETPQVPPPLAENPRPPPSTAPAAPSRCSSDFPVPLRRRRPQSVDCGREGNVKVGGNSGLFFLPTDGALAAVACLWGEAPAAAAAVAIPAAAGSPLQSARLLRGLRASLPAAVALTEAEARHRQQFSATGRCAQGRLPRISQRSLQQGSNKGGAISKCAAEGEDDDFEASSVTDWSDTAGRALQGDRRPSKKLASLPC
eukprot:TRINITY_DN12263_c0_g1_i3.p1 TRINITY_DN12263_c0_g1~~TRINITY_DN12263_c0_g1_i3.p1  ORF type:complete len:743 (-),score=159.54 TRINITY_DN12263_c0_g1_i3:134-2362(-)